MKKLYKLLLICLLILSGGMALKAQDKAYETPTLVNGYYEISKADHLFWFAEYVNTIDRTTSAKLMNDIDLEGGYWNTICETALYYNSYSNDYGYSGTFDGNGHVIKNFKVKSSTTADASAGLFGTVCGTIKNLGVENFTFEDGGKDIRAAAIVGQLITTGGKISNCYVKNATITPGEHVTGGIAGCVYDGTIENCYVVNSNINGSSGRYGHIVGDSQGDKSSTDRPGTVTNCYSDNTPLISDRKGNLSSVENKSAAQFASGEIAYLLQGEQQTDIWGQNIDNGETVQTYPVFSDAKVYKIYNSGCTHYGEFIYSNDANAEFYHEHSFTEDSNGFCTLCGGYEAAELVDGIYHIGNLGQLMWFANNVNTAHKVLLTADITIDNSVVWKPIGLQDNNSSVFNGDGHTITFENTNEGSVFGLFGSYNYSIIENLYLAGSITCNTTDNVGALVNSAYRTTIRNVISYVEVTNIGSGRAGGLAGQFGGQHSGELYSLIENCAVYADVTGNVAGGIIGHGWSGNQYYDIKNVAYAGDVTGSERQAAVIAYHGNNSSATKCKFENIYYCEKDALGFVGGGGNNYDLGTDVAAKTTAQFASGEVAYLLQGEQATQVWGQNIDNGETVQAYPVFGGAKIYKTSCGDNYYYSNANVEHSFNDNGFCNTCGNCEPAELVDNYYNISNAGNLVWFSKHVNNDNFSANAKLMNDIEMNAVQWTPIGTSDAYNGTFDGQGHTINNLWHNTGVADGGREGLFTLIGSNGVVKNIVLNNATIWGGSSYGFNSCGGIAIKNQGTISNCIIAGSTIQFGNYAHFGGIAGHNTGTIKNCAVRNSILRRRWGGVNNRNIGGITQTNNGTVTDCYSYDNIYEYGLTTCAISAEGNAPINSYQYTTSTVADAAETAKTKAQFASGEVAYLLQGEQTTQVWGQNIDNGETADSKPILGGAKVYEHTFDGTTLYSNSQTLTAGGKCGDKLYWNIDDENTLTIFGTGAMYDYGNSSNKAPWRSLNPAPTSLVLEDGITHIGNYAFRDCSGFTGSLTIPNSVTTIGGDAFKECFGFTGSLTIGNSVTSIGSSAFQNCSGFNGSLTIPNSVTTIGNSAFYGCDGFTEVYSFAETAPTLEKDAFDKPNNATLYYPASSKQSYNDNGWFEYFPQNIGFNGKCGDNLYWRVNDNILTIFGTGAMYDYGSDNNKAPWRSLNPAPTSLVLEEGITHIGNSAFCNCYGFKGSLTIPNSVTSIGNYAFYACFFTGSLTIPNSVTTIGNEAFRGCSGFTGSLTIPNSVTSIGDYAFYNCYGFTGDLTIGNSVRAIGDYAFWGCYGFTGSLTIPNSVTTIGNYAFQFCDGFTGSLTISNSVTTIGNSAFQKCSGFTEIFFYRDANPTIATSTFSYINANAKVYAPVIWSSFAGIPSEKLVKMATFVGEQSADASTGSATINGWVGLAEDQTWPDEDDHVAINASLVLGSQQDYKTTRQQGSEANSLWVKSFGYCGDGTTVNGSITIEDGGQLYCEIANGEVTVKKEILGYQQSESESKWYTIASPLKDTIQITTNSSFLTPNSDLYRYDEPSYTWQNAKNSANNGFNTIDPGRGYLYANAENTSLKFTGDINTETATYNLTAKSDVLKGFHLIGNPFTHDIYLGESIKTKGTQNIIFELNDSYGDGWNGAALNLSFSDGTPDKIITIESGNSKTETINVGSGVTVTVSFTKGSFPKECSFTIKYDDVEIICDKYSNEGSLTSVVDGETLTEFPVKEGKDILVNGYYTLTGEGAWTAEASTTEAIKPMQGILVKSLVDDSELKIYNTSRQPSAISRQQSRNSNQQSAISQQSLCISVSNAKYSDRAFVVFDKGVGLDKMNHENENIPLLYIPMEDADYAIAMMDINVNEIPVNFETNVMGEYTISLRQENCEFDELYLLDKETDEKVNILEQDYTFIATSSENPERFVLLRNGNTNGQEPTANSHFAYINNDNIVIYNIEGDADIKIFDALGRCVYHGESSDETTRIANGYSSGVYMIQKVDDNGVNVQKVMID